MLDSCLFTIKKALWGDRHPDEMGCCLDIAVTRITSRIFSNDPQEGFYRAVLILDENVTNAVCLDSRAPYCVITFYNPAISVLLCPFHAQRTKYRMNTNDVRGFKYIFNKS
jgi:hypothetical protein